MSGSERGSVLVVGGGGREHALVRALRTAPSQPRVLCAPGSDAIAEEVEVRPVAVQAIDDLATLAREEQVTLVVVGPEAPLVAGLADRCRADGMMVLGPDRAAAQLEGSKTFAKTVMAEAGVPTAAWQTFEDAEPAVAFARSLGAAVVKADGLAAGKGVVVADSAQEAEDAIRAILGGRFAEAGRRVVVEERLEGEELSVIALSDGQRVALLAPSQDHKRVGEGDRGPNTGGMGAYSPAPIGTGGLLEDVERTCLQPVVECLRERGSPFVGVLYAGLMITADGPKVLEYNVRFGDPEAQVILPRLDVDAYELFRSAAGGSLTGGAIPAKNETALTVVMASEGYPGPPKKGDAISGLRDVPSDVVVYHAGTKRDGDTWRTNGGRVLAVTGLGPDVAAAAARAYDGVQAIHWPGAHYRRDIGHRAIGRATES